ncbi:hypothetical protein A3D80_03225 [Candidatus Roizmanbacteria bacterium RIFCSPHIGHO2_02_FULL_40_13b]|uniref:Uncharacterized protein n=1 Tax=Candidatus Roizmanbacteria bacterium RIFCSPHIGHO2_01_FULL_39_24 TaxID=1802032 RepID=A0A1F7GLA6_9BACT|nr:MAG: hypothetical protein A2799_00970 [Candidatus Roizmanbacteria bacterium RIFCSPHIGHO2_01_FULL_39_24]OGK26979.1 MAG: hypothetical protein A3D80_03225 [Candidatus Roizmanbacteria bacterium RIFCSPHIGHO2_02_FULL_40_13b]OGK48866.1 MAG: hypothetical protein A3A56_01500 [Candidatus Roizmanbacteria bacterium RIFCSPLOWO2_01_FULL_40_32]OGK57174.1 MAG: hypothetical protein A3H83_00765 [Candidatus Roizmanbacteria bacterium RIFCSPLOWO2_02_FULL_39_8]
MDFVELIKSVNLIAIVAFIITIFVLLFELRHLFFHKKTTTINPVIPDFDGNATGDPQMHATPLNMHQLEETITSPVNKTLIFILLGVLLILVIIIILGFTLSKTPKKIKETAKVVTPVPTQVIEIISVQPTSPFNEQKEIPFDPNTETFSRLPSPTEASSGTGGQADSSPSQVPSPTGQVTDTVSSSTISSQSATITTMSSLTSEPTLVVSGNFQASIFFAVIPIIFLALALAL